MSLTLIRPYFRARCVAKGLVEHPDAFNIDNISSTVIDGSFYIGFVTANGRKLNQNDQEVDSPVDVIFYIKGYRTPTDGLDKAILKAEDLVKECEKPSNRLGSGIKNVSLNTISFEPLSDSNDNSIRVRLSFNVLTIIEV